MLLIKVKRQPIFSQPVDTAMSGVDTRVSVRAEDVLAKALKAFESFGKEVENVVNTLLIKVHNIQCVLG